VRWTAHGQWLDLCWAESGGPTLAGSPVHGSFGREMVDRIVRSSGGRICRTWRSEGLLADLRLPLARGESAAA
jgi:two-component sensor histidine kinase